MIDSIKVCERTGQQGTCESYPHYMKWGMPIELINRTNHQEYYTAMKSGAIDIIFVFIV